MSDSEVRRPASASPLATATDKVRESANWLLAAFATVGAVLAAGLQLANIGRLGFDTPARLALALVGLLMTLAAIIIAINAAAKVSARSRVSLALLNSPELSAVREEVDADREAMAGFTGVDDLAQNVLDGRLNVVQANAMYRAAYEAFSALAADASPSVTAAAQRSLDAATTNLRMAQRDLEFAESIKRQILELATFIRVKSLYDASKRIIAWCAGAAALGITLFAWGANPPESSGDNPAGSAATPSEVTVLLHHPSARTRKALGGRCDVTQAIDGVATRLTGGTYVVATLPTESCKGAWLTVGPADANVIPRLP